MKWSLKCSILAFSVGLLTTSSLIGYGYVLEEFEKADHLNRQTRRTLPLGQAENAEYCANYQIMIASKT